jgi:transposase
MNITTVGIDLAKNVFQVARGRCLGQGCAAQAATTRAGCAVLCEPAAMPSRDGGVCKFTSLGSYAGALWAHSAPNGATVRQTVCKDEQERRGRCGGNLRSCWPAVRQGFVKARTAQANQIRSLLGEFGLVIPQGICHVARRVPGLLEDASNELPLAFRQLIERLTEHLKDLDQQVRDFERQIIAWHRSSEASRELEKIPGIGPLAATALVASIADARSFDNGRQVSAWLGLVPRQSSSGGKSTLLGISKRGNVYLRTLLIHGARSAILAARKSQNSNVWLATLLTRRHANIAAVALANKNVRTVWALLAHGRKFQAGYVPTRMAA